MADATVATAPVREIGYMVTPSYNWWLNQNETTPELQWPQSVYVYDQMRRTDAQVGSVLRAVEEVIIRTQWRIDPAGARPEVVQLVADDFGLPIAGEPALPPARSKDRFDWRDHLRLSLLMLPFGHAYFEQVYRVDELGVYAHLRKLAYRPPTTIECINVADDGGLISIQQYWTQTNTKPQPIPVDRLVAYIHKREGGNWLGTSILRNCYKNWLLKDRLLRVQAQTIERNGMGVPLYKAPPGASPADIAAGAAMAQAWRSGEAAGSAIPNEADLSLVGVSGTLPDAEKVVRYHDEQIARAVLAHFLNLGSQTGSWALGSTFADFFTLSLQTLAQQIADTTTRHVIEDLVDVNWGPDEPAPRLVFDEIGSRQAATAEALSALVSAGLLTPDPTLEGATRQFYGLPPAAPDGETPAPEDAGTPDVAVPDAPTQTGEYSVAASAGVDLSDEASWIAAAAGVDTHPGGERLKRYWLFGEGAGKWATWTELYDHLRKYIANTKLLKATVSKWYLLRYGHTPPHHKGVHASALTGSPEALAAYAEEFGDEPDDSGPDDEAQDWELEIDAIAAALDELSGAVAASFNPRQPRIPKGMPGAGRFRSMVDHLKDAIEGHRRGGGNGHPFDAFDREQLRRVARKRGISLERNESKDSIAAKLLGDLEGRSANPHQEEIDRGERRHAAADVASEVEELAENGASPEEIRRRAASAADRRRGQAGEAELRSLASRLDGVRDVEQMRQAARAFAAEHGLSRIGGSGEHVAFDPALHQSVGGQRPRPGERVFVVRPGYSAPRDGWAAEHFGPGDSVIRRAVVEEGMSPAEEAAYNAGRPSGASAPTERIPARGAPKKRFEDMTEDELRAQSEARRARQQANTEAQRTANGGETDWERAMRRDNEALRRSGESEERRLITALDTEQRTLTVKRREIADVEAKIADAEASGDNSGSRYERLIDARDALRQELDDLDAKMSPIRDRLEALRRGDAPKPAPRVQRLAERQSKAGQKAAGVGVREESPKRRARRERIEQQVNEALDARERRDAEQAAVADIVTGLRSAATRDEAQALISGLSTAQLRDLASSAGVVVKSGANKTQLRNAIVYQLVGARLDSLAINP